MATINGLPVYRAQITDRWWDGITAVSFVDDPAVMSDFQAFAAKKEVQKFAIQNEEQRRVLGVLMRADFPIYREDPKIGGYYLTYAREDIQRMANFAMQTGSLNNTNLMHIAGFVEGAIPEQLFIKDTANGITPEGFDDITDGSLFAIYHIENDELWAQIKAGTFKGFSIECYCMITPDVSQDYADESVKACNGIFSLIKKFHKMAKESRIAEMLGRLEAMMMSFGKISTDKGVISWASNDDIKVGDEIKIEAEDGTTSPASDGEYTTDTKVYVVEGGKLKEIRDKQTNAEEGDDGNGDDESLRQDVEGLRKEVNELYNIVDQVLKMIGTTREEIEKMKKIPAEGSPVGAKINDPAKQETHSPEGMENFSRMFEK